MAVRGPTQSTDLPFVDEHVVVVAAGADAVWTALLESVDRAFSGPAAERYVRLVGGRPSAPAGPRPLVAGAALAGFAVVEAQEPAGLVLEGRHRFSDYRLSFRLEVLGPDATRLRAETRAAFPGLGGAAYRALVIGSRGHRLGLRRLLSGIRRDAEDRGVAPAPG